MKLGTTNRSDNVMNIKLQGTNLELTHEIRKFVYKKLNDCRRALGDVDMNAVQIDIELEKTTSRHPQERRNGQLYRAEANVRVPGRFIRAEESSMHLEPAIVKMKNTLTRNIRHWREHVIEHRRNGARKAKAMGFVEAEPAAMLEDEWLEPQAAPSSYTAYFEQDIDAPFLGWYSRG